MNLVNDLGACNHSDFIRITAALHPEKRIHHSFLLIKIIGPGKGGNGKVLTIVQGSQLSFRTLLQFADSACWIQLQFSLFQILCSPSTSWILGEQQSLIVHCMLLACFQQHFLHCALGHFILQGHTVMHKQLLQHVFGASSWGSTFVFLPFAQLFESNFQLLLGAKKRGMDKGEAIIFTFHQLKHFGGSHLHVGVPQQANVKAKQHPKPCANIWKCW